MENATEIINQVKKAVVGKDNILVRIFLAILARGHVLLEDIPGVGKTTIALAFSKAMGLEYSRMQFTPDVLPSDITGYSVPDGKGGMVFRKGALSCNLFLGDELNRATSRTQSALLEAMEEGNVTVDGVTHPLPQPFTVIATQNPFGSSGTSLLPDSQMDRFLMRLSVGYPEPENEVKMLKKHQSGPPLNNVQCVASVQTIMQMRDEVDHVFISDEMLQYIVSLITATRSNPGIIQGASPRASIAVTNVSKAVARLKGRDYVIPADVSLIWADTVAHRLILATGSALASGKNAAETILRSTPAPAIR